MAKIELSDDNFCFVCGKNNANGLKLDFVETGDGKIRCEFLPRKYHQGFAGIVHGGIIGLILDEAMVNLLWKQGKHVVTAHLELRLKKTADVGEKLFFEAGIEAEEKRLIYT